MWEDKHWRQDTSSKRERGRGDCFVFLKVNGVDTGNLMNEQLVKLLTSEDMYATILFSREPSITLL